MVPKSIYIHIVADENEDDGELYMNTEAVNQARNPHIWVKASSLSITVDDPGKACACVWGGVWDSDHIKEMVTQKG